MINKIESVLEQYVRPELLNHYGNVKVNSFKDGILEITLTGQCSNCPSANFTVENIIEKELNKYAPEVEKVVLVNSVSDELIDFAKRILNKKI